MKCRKCGNEIPDVSKFCPKCGTPAAGQSPSHDNYEKKNKKWPWVTGIFLVFIIGTGVWLYASGTWDAVLEAWADRQENLEETREAQTPKRKKKVAEKDNQEMAETTTAWDISSAATTAAGTEAAVISQANHRYELLVKDCTWTEAFYEASARGGYLVHFDTQEEYETVKQQMSGAGYAKIKFWVGGARNSESLDYHWVDSGGNLAAEILNSEIYAAAWMQNEPSYYDGPIEERFMSVFYYEKEKRWVWNDAPDNILEAAPNYTGSIGYIVEYDE